jgi:hypothetical protein
MTTIKNLSQALQVANFIPLRTKYLDDVAQLVLSFNGNFGETTKHIYAVIGKRVFTINQARSGEYSLNYKRDRRA